jgi:hypothetical protein
MKYLGRCPCPRCLISKDKIYKLGTKTDQWVRSKMARIDDETCRRAIEYVCKTIFEYGRGILSKAVESVVGAKSLVPTRVRISAMMNIHYITD